VSRCAGSLVLNQAVSGCSGKVQDSTITSPLTDIINVSLQISWKILDNEMILIYEVFFWLQRMIKMRSIPSWNKTLSNKPSNTFITSQ
jgi:hypothetical protein